MTKYQNAEVIKWIVERISEIEARIIKLLERRTTERPKKDDGKISTSMHH